LLVAAWLVAGAFLVWVHRDLTFAVDEYAFWETVGIGSTQDFVTPQNGHLVVLPFLTFKLLFSTFGPTLAPFTILEAALLAVISAGLYVFSRERIGPLLALLPATLPLFLGSGWPGVMPPMIGLLWISSIAPGLWAFVLAERDTTKADVAACGLLCVSLACFSLGLVFVAGCTVAILFSARRWKRLYVVAIPAVAWAGWHLWALKFGDLGAHPAYLLLLPAYGIDSIAANTAALFGRTLPSSPATALYLDGFSIHRFISALDLAIAVALACLVLVIRVGPRKLNRPSLWAVLAIPLVWWATEVVVLERFRTPDANRYYLAGVVILLLVVVELARGIRVTLLTAGVLFALAGVALAGNIVAFRDGRAALVALDQEARADMAMIDLEGRKGDQTFIFNHESLTPQSPFMFLTVSRYLDAVERFGSPADSLTQLAAAPESIRGSADTISARLLRLEIKPVERASKRGCRAVRAVAGSRRVVAPLPRGGAVLRSGTSRELRIGRFAAGFPVRLGGLTASRWAALEIPTDSSRRPWTVSAAGAGPLLVCPL
jgi:hypothetical protein